MARSLVLMQILPILKFYSSAEKANKEREDERWLIDVVEQFNQQQHSLSSGNVIQVGIRNIPSGLGAQILAAKKGKPAGYTPANALWLELLKAEGVSMQTVTSALVPNQAVFAIQPQVYQDLAQGGAVTFDRLIDRILAGQIKIGYANPYIASSALNLLYRTHLRSQEGAASRFSISLTKQRLILVVA